MACPVEWVFRNGMEYHRFMHGITLHVDQATGVWGYSLWSQFGVCLTGRADWRWNCMDACHEAERAADAWACQPID